MSAEEMKQQVAAAKEAADEAVGHLQEAGNSTDTALGQLDDVLEGTGNDKAENALTGLREAREKIDEAMQQLRSAMDEAEGYAALL
jgi:ABC-type transporter Mla subunit MlaD